jgi:hypothetical protein
MVSSDVLNLRDVSERNLQKSLGSLKGYLKFASMVWIRALRGPILDSVVVKHWSLDAGRAVKDFCDRHACDALLLRIDTLGKRWSDRRGGYILPASKARAVTKELNTEGRIVAFLEPVSPYCDRYSLAAITDNMQEKMTVEVVGPGFDASDLLRSDSPPHERFEAFLSRAPNRLALEQHYVIRPEDYTRTVEDRLVKVGARLRNSAYPRLILDSKRIQRTRLAEEAVDYLKRTRQAALLNHLEVYEPIPKHFINRFVTGVSNIVDGLRGYKVRLGPTSFSGTFTARGRFIFWDFFPADLARASELYLS